MEEFDFTEIFKSYESYSDAKGDLKARLYDDYSIRKDDADVIVANGNVQMSIGKAMVNLLLMRTFAYYGIIPEKEDLFQNSTVTQDSLEAYFDYILNKIGKLDDDDHIDYDEVRQLISDSEDEMCDLSGDYNVRVGNSISFRDFVRLECEDENAERLFNPKIKSGSFHSIEEQFSKEGKDLIKYFEGNKNCEMHPFVASETGVNKKQLTQMVGFVGLKPDINGNVIPVVISDNFLNGLRSVESYFINACGTKKALITNKKYTRSSGYLTRKLSLANIDHYHDNDIKDCGTMHFVIFDVNSDKKLKMIIGRHYYDINDAGQKISDELHTVTEDSTDLIGKKIGLRSPITCCGKHVCATCYGKRLSKVNKDINTGLTGEFKLTEPLTQRLLSAKHRATCCQTN